MLLPEGLDNSCSRIRRELGQGCDEGGSGVGAQAEDIACIERPAVWVQQTPEGPREILLIEAADPAHAFREMAVSQEPFDIWFRQVLLDTFGLDLTQPTGPPPEQVLDWSA